MLPQTELIRQLLLPTNESYSPSNFVKYMEDMCLHYEKDIRQSIKELLEEIPQIKDFLQSIFLKTYSY